MSKSIKYKIEFHTDWHCGSGLSAGADVDALVIKDRNGIAFIPGKTIKGLVREAVEEMLLLGGRDMSEDKRLLFKECFGNSEDRNIDSHIASNDEDDKYKYLSKGSTFFSNAELSEGESSAIKSNNAARFMYRQISNTAIGEDGIAQEHSLRKMETVVPCTLYGEILDIPDGFESNIADALRYIKRLGQSRNRGLGRCTITLTEGGK